MGGSVGSEYPPLIFKAIAAKEGYRDSQISMQQFDYDDFVK